eukprot:gene6103-6807_t
MDESRKKAVKSIVAQRLVLFQALERGRARSDDGCPISYSQENYIYNSGLSSSIILDIKNKKTRNKLKSTTTETDKQVKQEVYSEMADYQNNSEQGPESRPIRQLISIFEGSSMKLTARNSWKKEVNSSNVVPAVQSKKSEDGKPIFENIKSLSKEQETKQLARTFSSPSPSLINAVKSENEKQNQAKPLLPPKPPISQSNSPPKITPADVEVAEKELLADIKDEEEKQRPNNSYENCPSFTRRKTNEIKSVYVDPSFDLSKNQKKDGEEKLKPPSIKQRTLGRGEIKPYEIVDLMSKGDAKPHEGVDLALNEDKQEERQDKSKRMESMYVPTFGTLPANVDSDGYQAILEIEGPIVEIDSPLDDHYSMNSDFNETWDSDEDEYDTDDEILDGSQHQTCDGDVVKKKILNIVNEILTTEKTYEKRLHLLDQVFQARLMKEAKENSIIPEKVIQEIFSNLSSIYIFHSTMLRPDLEKRILNWSANEKIGDIFKTLGHCLKLYTDYVKNFDHAISTLNQWMKKSAKFASIIEEIQKMPECEHLTLQHHMLEPIQRVPRYKLLLTDYLKKLPEDSPDRVEAEESLVVISTAANHANDSMKGMDQFKKLVELEERISEGLHGESLATASRLFIKEGELFKIAARSDQKNLRVLILFNDLLMCCNKISTTGKLKAKQMMDIPGMVIQDNEDIDLGEQFAFRIKSRQRVLDLAASNEEDKKDWMNAISGVIQDYETKRGSLLKQFMEEDAKKDAEKTKSMKIGECAPVWVKDEDVTMCMLCAVRFSFLSRRHHCRSCGRIVCDNCSKYKARLAYTNNEVKRVCYVCHRKLNVDQTQQTDSYISKKTVIDRVARDPKRRRSTIVTEVKGELMWKAPGKKWDKGWFAISDMVLYAHKGRKDPNAQIAIPLPGYSVGRPQPSDDIDEGKHPYAFKVHFGNKKEMTYFFKADDQRKMQRWLDVITYSVKAERPPALSKTL